MKTFTFNKEYSVTCYSESTRYGFRHIAILHKNGCEVARNKATYYNRTWECYQFESVLQVLVASYFDNQGVRKYYKKFMQKVKDNFKKQDNAQLKMVNMVCVMGKLFCNTEAEKNTWDKKMLGTIQGVEFPEDFDIL